MGGKNEKRKKERGDKRSERRGGEARISKELWWGGGFGERTEEAQENIPFSETDALNDSLLFQSAVYEENASRLENMIAANEKPYEWFNKMSDLVDRATAAYNTYSGDNLQELQQRVVGPYVEYVMNDVRQREGAGGSSYIKADAYLKELEEVTRAYFPEKLPVVQGLREEIKAARPRSQS